MAVEKKSFMIKDGVSITDEVVAIIAGLAATEVDGVNSLAGNLKSDVIAKSGMSKLSKGIRVHLDDEKSLSVKVSINIRYGSDMPDVSTQVQEKIKQAIENMTGLTVNSIDVIIASISLKEKK